MLAEPPRASLILVDDDPHVLNALRFAFEIEGYRVRGFGSGEALLAAAIEPESCIVIDQNLPGVSGVEALAALRARGVNTPAILITSNPASALLRRAEAVRAAVVEKPLMGEALARAVRTSLDAPARV